MENKTPRWYPTSQIILFPFRLSSHNIWLRDHCRCPHCYHPKTKQRLLNTFQVSSQSRTYQFSHSHAFLLALIPPNLRYLLSIRFHQIPSDVQPLEIQSTTEGLHVLWPATTPISSTPDQSSNPTPNSSSEIHEPPTHTSLYPWRWLMNHSYSPALSSSKGTAATSGLERILWGKGIGASPPVVQFDEVMNSEGGVLKWLSKIVSVSVVDERGKVS